MELMMCYYCFEQAIRRGWYRDTVVFLKLGASLPEDRQSNILISISQKGYYDIIKLLLEKRIFNYKNPWKLFGNESICNEPLTRATMNGHYKVVEILLKYGADINFSGGKPLKFSVNYHHMETTKLLLKNGADIDDVLDFAIVGQSYDMTKLLLEHGADIDDSLINLSIHIGCDDIAKLLKDWRSKN